ncbi:MAG TPA: metallopeptidase family protein [Candidatus Saccharimonadales bacterium]|nr:metallopeptidase family protein [Candidatus Saccharimonadales bacterium]
MVEISDEQFAELIDQAIAHLPKDHQKSIQNVAFLYEDEPTADQREALKLQCNQTLYGLYQGVPLTKRQGVTSYRPDRITIFKGPITRAAQNVAELKEMIRHTVWHEVAHYFGLDHDQIHHLER